jgi:hypothetical protein
VKPLGDRKGTAVAPAHLGDVLCHVIFGPDFFLYCAPLTAIQIFKPHFCLAKKCHKKNLCHYLLEEKRV